MGAFENVVRDEVTRELYRIMNVTQFGEQIIAERLSDAVLKRSVVMAITSLTAAAINRQIVAGTFPAPVSIGEAAEGWLLSEIGAWVAARKAARDAAPVRLNPRNGKDANQRSRQRYCNV